MKQTFFFYDLETSGFNPKTARIMQFAGQRTDSGLKPIGQPVNTLIKLTADILPDPGAILVTGITPAQTHKDGITEAEFLKIFHTDVATEGTVFVGFNSLRFDDEFMRYLHYRNFYDPYEWHWQGSRSRWDLLDMVRMMRALRPEGINWPFDSTGKPSNRLELLAAVNKLEHTQAHDALSDVTASIGVARLIRDKQPKLFKYLFTMRGKKEVEALVGSGEPFVYSSGKYDSKFEKTTIAIKLADHPDKGGALVYDLRHDPAPFINMSPAELAEAWKWNPDPEARRLPIKTLKYNRCPAIAPLSVLDQPSFDRLRLDMQTVEMHQQTLGKAKDFAANILRAIHTLDTQRQSELVEQPDQVDQRLYDGFFSDYDKKLMGQVRSTDSADLNASRFRFKDARLEQLLPLYKARNFAASLSTEEKQAWDEYRTRTLMLGTPSRLDDYLAEIKRLEKETIAPNSKHILEELTLYGRSQQNALSG